MRRRGETWFRNYAAAKRYEELPNSNEPAARKTSIKNNYETRGDVRLLGFLMVRDDRKIE